MPEISTQTLLKTIKPKDPDYFKTYYQTHKEKYTHQKIKCDACECDVLKNDYNRHCRSKKHIKKSLN